MRVKGWLCAALGACILWSGGDEALAADPLVIESWRAEDQVIWDEHLLPAFHAKHPGIRVEFRPEDALAYDGRVNDRLSNRRAGDLIAWAKANGFESTLPAADMRVTILYSKRPVDPMAMGETWVGNDKGELRIKPGGPRALEQFEGGAVVLQFASWELQSRHDQMVREGASHDYPEYLPHVTLTYEAPDGLDLATVLPYTGELRFGPEIFAPIDEDWKSKIEEA
jgi:hypothetical protein